MSVILFLKDYMPRELRQKRKKLLLYRTQKRQNLSLVLLIQQLYFILCIYTIAKFLPTGGVEHHNLKLSQLKRNKFVISGKIVNEYVNIEYGSKNNQGGFSSLNLSNKIVHQYEIDSERCHVKLFDLYLQKLPPDANDKNAFYFRPLTDIPSNLSNYGSLVHLWAKHVKYVLCRNKYA